MDIKFIEEYTKELEKKSKKDLINLVISNEVMILALENMYKTEEQQKLNFGETFSIFYKLYNGKDFSDFKDKLDKFNKENFESKFDFESDFDFEN